MPTNQITNRTSIEVLAKDEEPSIPDAVPLRLGEDLSPHFPSKALISLS